MGTDGFDIYPMIMRFNFSWTRALWPDFHTHLDARYTYSYLHDHVIRSNLQSHNTLVHIENEKLPKHVLF